MVSYRWTVIFVLLGDVALIIAAILLPESKGTLAILPSLIIATWVPIFARHDRHPVDPRLVATGISLLVLGLVVGVLVALAVY